MSAEVKENANTKNPTEGAKETKRDSERRN